MRAKESNLYRTWEEFEEGLSKLQDLVDGVGSTLLYRGLGDSTWSLTTTLERFDDRPMTFDHYYRVIAAAEPEIRTFCETRWDHPIEPYPGIAKLARQYEAFHLHLWGGQLKAAGYMSHLRHHGFPSPLLDWTRSPYVAAFFAFRGSTQPQSGQVSIFVYCETMAVGKADTSDKPRIFPVGPNVLTHPRHYLQQGQYTLCLRFIPGDGWQFVRHETVLDDSSRMQDFLWKIDLEWSMREEALRRLDAHNINAFSLFQSDEALLETIAIRRLSSAI